MSFFGGLFHVEPGDDLSKAHVQNVADWDTQREKLSNDVLNGDNAKGYADSWSALESNYWKGVSDNNTDTRNAVINAQNSLLVAFAHDFFLSNDVPKPGNAGVLEQGRELADDAVQKARELEKQLVAAGSAGVLIAGAVIGLIVLQKAGE